MLVVPLRSNQQPDLQLPRTCNYRKCGTNAPPGAPDGWCCSREHEDLVRNYDNQKRHVAKLTKEERTKDYRGRTFISRLRREAEKYVVEAEPLSDKVRGLVVMHLNDRPVRGTAQAEYDRQDLAHQRELIRLGELEEAHDRAEALRAVVRNDAEAGKPHAAWVFAECRKHLRDSGESGEFKVTLPRISENADAVDRFYLVHRPGDVLTLLQEALIPHENVLRFNLINKWEEKRNRKLFKKFDNGISDRLLRRRQGWNQRRYDFLCHEHLAVRIRYYGFELEQPALVEKDIDRFLGLSDDIDSEGIHAVTSRDAAAFWARLYKETPTTDGAKRIEYQKRAERALADAVALPGGIANHPIERQKAKRCEAEYFLRMWQKQRARFAMHAFADLWLEYPNALHYGLLRRWQREHNLELPELKTFPAQHHATAILVPMYAEDWLPPSNG